MNEVELRDFVRKMFSFSDEDMAKLTPDHWRVYEKLPELAQYRIRAKVVKAEHCAMHKPGDQYVFEPGGLLHPEESSPMCLWALAHMLPFAFMVFDRVVEGTDPNNLAIKYITCADTGIDCYGTGRATFTFEVDRRL